MPGTPIDNGPCSGISLPPGLAFAAISYVSPRGAIPLPRYETGRGLRGSCTMAKRSPPSPHMSGRQTDAAKAALTAASTALPPTASARIPALETRGWAEATIPPVLMTGAMRRSRQGKSDRCPGNPIIAIHQSITHFDTFALAYYVLPESTAEPSGAGVGVSVGTAAVGISAGVVSVGIGVSVGVSTVGLSAGTVPVGSTALVGVAIGVGTSSAATLSGSWAVVPRLPTSQRSCGPWLAPAGIRTATLPLPVDDAVTEPSEAASGASKRAS